MSRILQSVDDEFSKVVFKIIRFHLLLQIRLDLGTLDLSLRRDAGGAQTQKMRNRKAQ
jgi:hypothetical protein